MASRERRSWTPLEDQLLRAAVEKEDPGNSAPSKWHAIAKHVPNRTNKDCRKRWFAKMASDVVKGGWAPDEDERLVSAIDRYGTRWSLVATVVQTRNSDQCAKRWTDTLNPAIDRSTWTAESDSMLLRAVEEHGKVWTKIVRTYFPGRTGLAAKNRYNSITRFSSDGRVSRRASTGMVHRHSLNSYHRKASSASSVSPPPTHSVPDFANAYVMDDAYSDTSDYSPQTRVLPSIIDSKPRRASPIDHISDSSYALPSINAPSSHYSSYPAMSSYSSSYNAPPPPLSIPNHHSGYPNSNSTYSSSPHYQESYRSTSSASTSSSPYTPDAPLPPINAPSVNVNWCSSQDAANDPRPWDRYNRYSQPNLSSSRYF